MVFGVLSFLGDVLSLPTGGFVDLSAANKLLDIRFLQKSEITYEVMIEWVGDCIFELRRQKELSSATEEDAISHWLQVAEMLLIVCKHAQKKGIHSRMCHRKISVLITDFLEKDDDDQYAG